jgi:hypothetical protein
MEAFSFRLFFLQVSAFRRSNAEPLLLSSLATLIFLLPYE